MDIIANMMITIKNGGNARKADVMVPFSKYKQSIAKALLDGGFIAGYDVKKRDRGHDQIQVELKYDKEGQHPITQVRRVSKPSRRVYASVKDIYEVKHGRGKLFLSTPKGIMTGDQARTEHVGGEILFEIF